jgi:hypothetical protein
VRETRKHVTHLISGDRDGRGKDAAVHGRSEIEVDVVVVELVHHKRFEAAVDERHVCEPAHVGRHGGFAEQKATKQRERKEA